MEKRSVKYEHKGLIRSLCHLFLLGNIQATVFAPLTTIYQIMAVLIPVIKYGGGGFQFIWFHSGKRIMNRLFASLPPNRAVGETKGKTMGGKKRQKIVTKTKRIIRPFASGNRAKKGGKTRKKWQLCCQSSLEKYYELGPGTGAQGHLDSSESSLIRGVGRVELNWAAQEDVLSRSNVFCPRCSRFGPRGRLECINSGAN